MGKISNNIYALAILPLVALIFFEAILIYFNYNKLEPSDFITSILTFGSLVLSSIYAALLIIQFQNSKDKQKILEKQLEISTSPVLNSKIEFKKIKTEYIQISEYGDVDETNIHYSISIKNCGNSSAMNTMVIFKSHGNIGSNENNETIEFGFIGPGEKIENTHCSFQSDAFDEYYKLAKKCTTDSELRKLPCLKINVDIFIHCVNLLNRKFSYYCQHEININSDFLDFNEGKVIIGSIVERETKHLSTIDNSEYRFS